MTLDELKQRITVPVPTAAVVLGISRAHAYQAVRDGTIPVVRVGRRFSVPTLALVNIIERACAEPTA